MREIVDVHCHIYPSKIASKASRSIGEFYTTDMSYDGTVSELIDEQRDYVVTHAVVHSCATKVEQVRSINEFILRESREHSEFIPFMTLHPDMSERDIEHEVDWAVSQGFRGVKLHPEFQRFFVDSDEADKIYRVVEGRLPILFHAGDSRYEFSAPVRVAMVAERYPNLKVIAAHLGAYRRWNEWDVYEGLSNVWFDTSSTLMYIDTDTAMKIIRRYGVERYFFGTDYPMWSLDSEMRRFDALPLRDIERERILSLNAREFFNL